MDHAIDATNYVITGPNYRPDVITTGLGIFDLNHVCRHIRDVKEHCTRYGLSLHFFQTFQHLYVQCIYHVGTTQAIKRFYPLEVTNWFCDLVW